MPFSSVIILAIFASSNIKVVLSSALPSNTRHRPCTTFTVQVPITAQNHIYDLVPVNSNIDAIHYAQDLDSWDNPPIQERIVKNVTISRTYDIYVQLCVPPNGSKKSYLQLASHGGGFDSRYWDSEVEPEHHSYVDAALAAGYSILTYDRIGCGQSSKPDAYTDVQLPAEVEVLRVLSEMVRNGTMLSLASGSGGLQLSSVTFDKIIHVGHSFGSITTYGLIALYPNVSDAAMLTGFLVNKEVFSSRQTANDLKYARESDPQLFADTGSGYVIPGTPSAYQTGFFSSRVNTTSHIGGFQPKMLEYAYSIRQPTAEAEMGSGIVGYLEHPTASEYTGPVQLVVGEFDWIVCLGDCRNTYNATQVEQMFPKAKDVGVHLQPGTGHGLLFHNNASSAFKASFDWLSSNGV